MKLKHLLPLTAAALAVAAAPAQADYPAQTAPAAGVIEHRVIEVFDATPVAGGPQRIRTEHFVARGRDRAAVYDAATGAMTSEVAKNGTDLRSWDGDDNVLRISDAGVPALNFIPGRVAEGENVARLIADGTYKVTGETTWNGRAALTLAVPAELPGRTLTSVIAKDTKQLLETTEVDGTGTVTFSRKVVVDEDLPLTAETDAKLEMSSHPGATVTGAAARAKKAKARAKARKAKQRRAAKAKRR
jgi:hypothetical protein